MKLKILSIVAATSAILGLVTTIFTLDSRYAKSEEVKRVEQQTIKTLEQFQRQLDIRYENQRYQMITDQIIQYKLLLRQNPNDEMLKEDLDRLISEREAIRERLNKMLMQVQ